jgi:phosphoribosylformylglycinamidine synthase
MVGLLEDYRLAVGHSFTGSGSWIYLLGETFPELGGSAYAEVVLGVVAGRPPALDLDRERHLHRLLVELARADLIESAHDCAEGGLAVTLAECAIAGRTGFAVGLPGDQPSHIGLFSESASRAVVSVPWARLGETGGPRIVFDGLLEVTVEEIDAAYEAAIPALLGS